MIGNNHHVFDFICGAFSPAVEGSATPDQLKPCWTIDLKTIEDEHHGPLGVLSKTADGLPGFGIVAAVLGIVITMGAIDGPVNEIGEKVGAALVGTFLGILASYGFIGPLVGRMESMGARGNGVFPDDLVGRAGVREEMCRRRWPSIRPAAVWPATCAQPRGARSIVQSGRSGGAGEIRCKRNRVDRERTNAVCHWLCQCESRATFPCRLALAEPVAPALASTGRASGTRFTSTGRVSGTPGRQDAHKAGEIRAKKWQAKGAALGKWPTRTSSPR